MNDALPAAGETQQAQVRTQLKRRRVRWAPVAQHAILISVSLLILYPFLSMLFNSFKQIGEIFEFPARLFPSVWTLEGWQGLFARVPVVTWFGNSILISVEGTVINLALCAPAAYAFARLRWRGRDLIFRGVISTLMLPLAVFLVPLYLVTRDLGLLNSLLAQALPVTESVFGVFLLAQFFRSIPTEMEEAARVDGANQWQVFTRVFLPLAQPGVITLAVFTFLWKWNMFLWPLLVVSSTDKYPIVVGVVIKVGSYISDMNILLAGASLIALPVLALYALFQNYIIHGEVLSGLKG